MLTEVEARAKGAVLMSKLKGAGWWLRVWENMGWHFAAHNKHIAVYWYNDQYSAMLTNDEQSGSGEIYWTDSEHFEDPNEAVDHQMKVARAFLNKLRRTVEYVEQKVLGRHG